MSQSSLDPMRAEISVRYRALALMWAAAKSDPSVANERFREHHRYYKAVRDSDAGRAGITDLLGDPEESVRLLAATHSLAWQPDEAAAVLEHLAERPGLYSLDAKYTLKSFREGKLNLDW
jgi:Domain of unknown function (DUF2019)